MKEIRLDEFDIRITFNGAWAASITSKLTESCDGEGYLDNDTVRLDAALSAIESIVLAHAVAGVDIESPEYRAGLVTAVDAITNNLGGA